MAESELIQGMNEYILPKQPRELQRKSNIIIDSVLLLVSVSVGGCCFRTPIQTYCLCFILNEFQQSAPSG